MASEGEYRAAIAKVKHSLATASRLDFELAETAAKLTGELGDKAREALSGR